MAAVSNKAKIKAAEKTAKAKGKAKAEPDDAEQTSHRNAGTP